jgi:hypothetical protein
MESQTPETRQMVSVGSYLGQKIGIKTAQYLRELRSFRGLNELHLVLAKRRDGRGKFRFFWCFIHMQQKNETHYTERVWSLLSAPHEDELRTLQLEQREVSYETSVLFSDTENLVSLRLGGVTCSDAAIYMMFTSYSIFVEEPEDFTYEEWTRQYHMEPTLNFLQRNFVDSCAECKGLPSQPVCAVCNGTSEEPILDAEVETDYLDLSIFTSFRNAV